MLIMVAIAVLVSVQPPRTSPVGADAYNYALLPRPHEYKTPRQHTCITVTS